MSCAHLFQVDVFKATHSNALIPQETQAEEKEKDDSKQERSEKEPGGEGGENCSALG